MTTLKSVTSHGFGWLARALLSLLFATCRVEVYGGETESRYLRRHRGRGLLYASWHRGMLFFTWFYRYLGFLIMVSLSDDGEFAAQTLRRFGWITIRGSSSRRGLPALKEMAALFARGRRGGLLVDAPQGPRCVSKIGIVLLARITGLPIIPVMWSADRRWRAGSWDRTIIPKPFARIVVVYAEDLIRVPRNASRAECEAIRARLDRVLNTLMRQVDRHLATGGVGDPRNIAVAHPRPE